MTRSINTINATTVSSDVSSLDSPVVLIQYPQGTPCTTNNPQYQLYKNNDTRKSHQRVLLHHTDAAVYVAKNYAEQNYKNNVQKCLVGVYNNQSNTIRLYDTTHIYNANQHIKNDNGMIAVSNTPPIKTEDTGDADTDRSYVQSRTELIETYGSRKRKRDIRSAAANQVTMQQSVSDVLSTTLSQSHAVKLENADSDNVDTVVQDGLSQLHVTMLPPHDSTTDQATQIYDIYNIIGVAAWEQLDSKQLIDRHNNTIDTLSTFVQHRTTLLSALEHDAKQMKIKAKILLHIDKLIKFIQLPPKRKQQGMYDRRLNIPTAVQQQLLDDFCVSQPVKDSNGNEHTEYRFNAQMKTKAYCWLCVLCLIGADTILLENDITLLAADLKLTIQSVITYFKEVGCTTASKSKVQLSAPLTLPQLKGKRQARR